MTDVASISNQSGSSTAQSGGSTTALTNKTLGTTDFLQMLIAQLKNQDPLNPLSGTDFAAQLAQFSSLEQLTNANTQLGNLGTSLTSLTNAQLVNTIGSQASAKGNALTVNGPATNVVYNLSGDAQQATITIYDGNGMPIKTINASNQKAGLNTVNWDTTNVTNGAYTFAVSAVDGSGKAVAVDTMVTGTVSGVTYKNGTPYLSINGQDVPYSGVVSVTKPPA